MSKAKREKRGQLHRLTLVDRGDVHIHRWAPTCSCGWHGVPARRRWAGEQYRLHIGQVEAQVKRGIGRGVKKQRLTPRRDLPEALR